MIEEVEVVLMYAFESPKKDWTQVTFGFDVNNTYEKGFKPLEMWYNRKGILSEFTQDMYGRKVKARFTYEGDLRDPNKLTRKVSEFDLDGRTYHLV